MFTLALCVLVGASCLGSYFLGYWMRGRELSPPDHRLPPGYEFYEPPGSGLGYVLAHMQSYEPALFDRLKIQKRTTGLIDGKHWERYPTWDELFLDLTPAASLDVQEFVDAFFKVLREHGVWKCVPALGMRLEEIGRFSLNEHDRAMVRQMMGFLPGEKNIDRLAEEVPFTFMGNRDPHHLKDARQLAVISRAGEECVVGILVPEARICEFHYRRILIQG